MMTPEQRQKWAEDGFLHLTDLVPAESAAALATWAEEIAELTVEQTVDSPILQHYEATETGDRLARSENMVPNHAGVRDLITRGPVPDAGAALLGEPVTLYKEKINYKMPGGAGFRPHQDATAYKFVDEHLTCMIAIDDTTEANGCLELAKGMHGSILPTNGDGCIDPDTAAGLTWVPIPMMAGEVLWFHSRTPHRSGDNTTGNSRRAIFLTFNASAQGDLRSAYYADKIEQLRSTHDHESARVSTIGHFRGKAPTNT